MYFQQHDLLSLFEIVLITVLQGSFLFLHIQAIPIDANDTTETGLLSKSNGNPTSQMWSKGKIPYLIDEFSFDKVLRDRIRVFLEDVTESTKLTFIELPQPPEDENERWVLFVNRRGSLPCQDHTPGDFTATGVQRVVVGYDCVGAEGAALGSAVLALAGVPPQHNAPNRDEYIEIIKDNILPDKAYLFNAVPKENWPFGDFKYDFNSAGHYTAFKYSKNGRATIKSKNESSPVQFEEAFSLSDIDIKKIKLIYENSELNPHNSEKCNKLYTRKNIAESITKLRRVKPDQISISPFDNSKKDLLAMMTDVDTDE